LGRGLVIITLAAFIISSYRSINQGFYNLFPERYRSLVKELMLKMDKTVGGYIRAKFLESIIVGLVVWIALLIIGVPRAPAIAFIAAILNPIPYVGPAVATIPATLSALTVGWVPALITFIVIAIIQGLDGNVLAPILLAQSISVNPVTVLVSILAGGALFGFWGIVLSIPFAAFMQLLINDYYLKSDWYLGKKRRKDKLPREAG
jgi:predicted PurR-regulated permease PerM